MLTPILCTCGLPVGDVAAIYRNVLLERVRDYLGEDGAAKVLPTQAHVDIRSKIDMEDVLSDLGLEEYCCRMTVTTTMDWRDYYY